MKPKLVISLVSALAALALPSPAAKPLDVARGRPNVLFIAIDDLNDWVGCLGGHPQAHTPNIDRLAARGTLFANAHCQAPLCNPSRSSLLTGLRPSSTGIYGLVPGIRAVEATRDCVTLPQYFAAHGYFTASFGKVFHDGSIPPNLQKNEFNIWGPAPGMPLPKQKFVHTPSEMRAVLPGMRVPFAPCAVFRVAKMVRSDPGGERPRVATCERQRTRRHSAVFMVSALETSGTAPLMVETKQPVAAVGARLSRQHHVHG